MESCMKKLVDNLVLGSLLQLPRFNSIRYSQILSRKAKRPAGSGRKTFKIWSQCKSVA